MAQPPIEQDQLEAAPALDGTNITSVDAITVSGENAAALHDAANLTGTLADARVSQSSVTQHQAALSITESQISDLGSYQPLDSDLTTIAALVKTKGNVIVANGTNWVNVGVGTNGQVLEADSTQASGVKWATPSAGSPAFRGAWATRSGLVFGVSDGVSAFIPFEAEEYDTDSIHDNVINNTRLTVPAGVTRIRLTGAIRHNSSGGSIQRSLHVYKNGAVHSPSLQNIDTPVSTANFTQIIIPIVLSVTSGDYFEMNITPTGGNIVISNFATHFAMEIIE